MDCAVVPNSTASVSVVFFVLQLLVLRPVGSTELFVSSYFTLLLHPRLVDLNAVCILTIVHFYCKLLAAVRLTIVRSLLATIVGCSFVLIASLSLLVARPSL